MDLIITKYFYKYKINKSIFTITLDNASNNNIVKLMLHHWKVISY